MARGFRFDIEEIKSALETTQTVLSVDTPTLAGKLDFRKNLLDDYTAAFSARFISDQFIQLLASELFEEILKEMRKKKSTSRLADGLEGQAIAEKRRGLWKRVPKPRLETFKQEGFRTPIFGDENSPIRMEVFTEGEDSITFAVALQHPLYIIMHSGARPHNVPPQDQYHVFPTKELIAQTPDAAYSKYGPDFFTLRSVPWRAKDGPRTDETRERDRHGKWRTRLRPVRLKWLTTLLPAGNLEGHPFLGLAFRRVVERNKDRLPKTITERIRQRGIR